MHVIMLVIAGGKGLEAHPLPRAVKSIIMLDFQPWQAQSSRINTSSLLQFSFGLMFTHISYLSKHSLTEPHSGTFTEIP